jgi:small subunit ribosomal protein S18
MANLPKKNFNRKKACKFCTDREMQIDYKDPKTLGFFVTERSKIVPRRISGNCAYHQRELTTAVKRARSLALVGFTAQTDG